MKTLRSFPLMAAALLVGALAVGACGDDSPDPAGPSKPVTPPAAPLKDADLVTQVLADGIERVIPALVDGAEKTRLAEAFSKLATAVTTKVVKQVQAAMPPARDAVAAFAAAHHEDNDTVEMDVLRIYLDYVDDKVAETLAGV